MTDEFKFGDIVYWDADGGRAVVVEERRDERGPVLLVLWQASHEMSCAMKHRFSRTLPMLQKTASGTCWYNPLTKRVHQFEAPGCFMGSFTCEFQELATGDL